jgi:transcription-repair coupling factor (superfamily II helicase)
VTDLGPLASPLAGPVRAVDDVIAAALPLGSRVDVVGAPAGATGHLVARLIARSRRSVVAVAADEAAALRLAADVRYFAAELAGERAPAVLRYPDHDLPLYSALRSDRRNLLGRVAALAELHAATRVEPGGAGRPVALVVPAAAFRRLVMPRDALAAHGVRLAYADEVDRDELAARLVAAGYHRAPLVEERGTFAVRGALVDVFPPSADQPLRVELDGDLLSRIRTFDPDTQMTTGERDEARIDPAAEVLRGEAALTAALARIRAACDEIDLPTVRTRELLEAIESGSSLVAAEAWLPAFHGRLDPLWRYLPEGSLCVVDDPPRALETWRLQDEAAERALDELRSRGEPALPVDAFLAGAGEARAEIDARSRVFAYPLAAQGPDPWDVRAEPFDLGAEGNDALVKALQQRAAQGRGGGAGAGVELFAPLVERLLELTEVRGAAVRLVAHSAGQAERLLSIVRGHGSSLAAAELLLEPWAAAPRPGVVQVVVGELARGCVLPGEGRAWIAEEEVLGRPGRRSRRRRRAGAAREAFDDLSTLELDEMVVHVEHGIGRYRGLVHREVLGVEMELLHIEYLGGDRLYLPVYRLDQIHKYVGGEAIKLDRLGGQTFAKRKSKARRHVEELADELLRVQAARAALPGTSCGPTDPMFVQLEATFPFEETAEQQHAIDDVIDDLESERVMDRLVCGDVGFGKTEVAIRAAFRVVLSGRQVAVLVPTTVLAQQHFQTFRARLASLPVGVEVLSRFRSPQDQARVLAGLKKGTVDIVIGTHRLLSKDVFFKALGLLVIDEEHRFGVEHKERLKKLRTQVDVLTLSATPIPRTLQMALSDMRDLSLMTTPPEGRVPVRTYVTQVGDAVIRDAIDRELARGGQVFYVRNRVAGLRERTDQVASLVPGARVRMAHGQMAEGKLEEIMLEFVEGRVDVLVCTTIIESGLDVPRANTVIIERADQLGLAQLYHIRGRVGRAQERAYAYLLVPPPREMTEDGRRRIAALQRLTELGSGFALATMDLEIRGAGELLGVEQSGEVAAVGYQMYVELLEEAIHQLRGDPPRVEIDPEISLDVSCFIPEDHVPDTGQRLTAYKRLASAEDEDEVREIAAELRDRFGPAPPPVENLLRAMELKTACRRLGALGVEGTRRQVTLHLSDSTRLKPEKVLALVTAPRSPYRVTPDMRLSRRLVPEQHTDSIEAASAVVRELLALVEPEAPPAS